jgi:hypothetical protein
VKKHILIDANVAAAFYVPRSTQSTTLLERSRRLFSGGSPSTEPSFMIPNFCIAEVFAVIEKYRWGSSWIRDVKKVTPLTSKEFKDARTNFGHAIHNAEFILQYELNRYHILCVDLIAPVNAAYQIKRKTAKSRPPPLPAKTFDLLFVAMGIWLQKQLGRDQFIMVTGDARIRAIAARARSQSLSITMRNHLDQVAAQLGFKYGPDIYPEVIDLVHATPAQLRHEFPNWTPSW